MRTNYLLIKLSLELGIKPLAKSTIALIPSSGKLPFYALVGVFTNRDKG